MTRLGAVFWGGLVLASGFATFSVKYAVQGIDDELARARRRTVAETQEIRVLTAEWAYLNQPERLSELNRSFLQLAPMTAKQLQGKLEEIALRPPPARVPETVLAAHAAATDDAEERLAGVAGGGVAGGAVAADPADAATDGAAALAEALQLLGGAPEKQTVTARLARMAPIGAAQAAEVHAAAEAAGAAPPLAAAAAGARVAAAHADGAAALAEALQLLGRDGAPQTPRVRMAKATPGSLDSLISTIAASR